MLTYLEVIFLFIDYLLKRILELHLITFYILNLLMRKVGLAETNLGNIITLC